MDTTLHAVFVLVYLVALIGVGALKASRIKSQEDFSLAGRGLSTFVLAGTLLATWIGTGSIFSNAEKTYEVGLSVLLLPMSSAVGILALFLLAGRIRRFGQFTIPDILQARFGAPARVLAAVTLVLAYVIIVSYQYRAGAAVIQSIWPGVGPRTATCAAAFFVILYTALAGMFSVAYTDVANGILMILGIGVALPILWGDAGGWSGIQSSMPPESLSLTRFSPVDLVSYMLPTFLLLLGDANMYQRFFSARSPAVARRSALGMFAGVALLEAAIILLAFLGSVLVHQGAMEAPALSGHVIVQVAFHAVPPWLGALLVGTVVAVVVSTADSYLLAPATSVVRDLWGRAVGPEVVARHSVRAGRTVVVVLGVVALLLAFLSDQFFDVALFAYTIYGAAITPPLMAAFFWRRATPAGAAAALATGALTALVWQLITWQPFLDWTSAAGHEALHGLGRRLAESGVEAVIPASLLNVVALVGVSLLTRPRSGADGAP